jgi:putative methionine-R-sulfoxide reductase with GAF domain
MVSKTPREIDLERERAEDDQRFTTSLAGLAVALFLIWLGFYVIDQLAKQSKLEDCVMQGRADCMRIELTPQR